MFWGGFLETIGVAVLSSVMVETEGFVVWGFEVWVLVATDVTVLSSVEVETGVWTVVWTVVGSDGSGSEGSGSDGSGSEGSGSEGPGSEGSGSEGSGSEGSGSEGSGNEGIVIEGSGNESIVIENSGSEGSGSEGIVNDSIVNDGIVNGGIVNDGIVIEGTPSPESQEVSVHTFPAGQQVPSPQSVSVAEHATSLHTDMPLSLVEQPSAVGPASRQVIYNVEVYKDGENVQHPPCSIGHGIHESGVQVDCLFLGDWLFGSGRRREPSPAKATWESVRRSTAQILFLRCIFRDPSEPRYSEVHKSEHSLHYSEGGLGTYIQKQSIQ